MEKIKDRVFLGIISGIAGNLGKIAIDEVSLRLKVSQRSFKETAAGVWVSKKKEATNLKGHLLGSLFDFGMSSLGGIAIVELLSRTGKDHLMTKGIFSGVTIGSTITAFLSALPANKVKPKDAASNLSYMLSHAVYGAITIGVASKLGHPSLYDVEPKNDYLEPTEKTTAEIQKAYPNNKQENVRINETSMHP